MMIRTRQALVVVLMFFSGSSIARAHEFRSAFIEVIELDPSHVSVHIQLSRAGEGGELEPAETALSAKLAPGCAVAAGHPSNGNGKIVYECDKRPFSSRKMHVAGMSAFVPEAIVHVRERGGAERTLLVNRESSTVSFEQGRGFSLASYTKLGVEHIAFGFDHLLFVLGLLLVVRSAREIRRVRAMLQTVTAFTIAHSLTLGASMLGGVTLASRPVELLIAASILLLAFELSRTREVRENSLTFRKPWLIAFVFGLVHGFGFAGALSEIGLPENSRIWALFQFNLGVEIGQLVFVGGFAAIFGFIDRTRPQWAEATYRLSYTMIGALAVAWICERVAVVF